MIENARNMGNAGLTYTVSQFDIGTNLYLTDHRLRWAEDFWAPGYARLDLFGRYHLTGHFDLYGRVQNALDHDIIEALGFRNPGVYFVAGANYSFH
jgi:outer membrane cobalamin receptor